MEQDVETGFRTMCSTCLSSDRDLFLLNNFPQVAQLFKLIMYDFAGDRFGENPQEIEDLVCWECLALMKRFFKFKWQAHSAQEHLRVLELSRSQNTMDHTYMSQSLSSLEMVTKTDYNEIYFDISENDEDQPFLSISTAQAVRDNINLEIDNHILEVPEIVFENPVTGVMSHIVIGTDALVSSTDTLTTAKGETPHLTIENSRARKNHVDRYHREGLQCDHCKKRFVNRTTLTRHLRLHEGPLPREECPICHKLVRVIQLKYHIQRHKNKNRIECVDCNKIFSHLATYQAHMKYSRAHASDQVFKFPCPMCNKGYPTKETMQDHFNYQHLGKTSHKRPKCDKTYDDISDAPLAEALAVDSGSEEKVDQDEVITQEELPNISQEKEEGPEGEAENVDMGDFIWSADYNTYTGRRETFLEEVGPKIEDTDPLEIFLKIWDKPLIEMVAEQTNLYAWQTIVPLSETGIPAKSRLNDWVETSVSELYRLIGIIILMGICVRGQLDEYWSTGILGMPGFREIMSKNRFLLLMRFLYFSNNYDITERVHARRLAKISPLISYLTNKFQAVYSPRRELSIDESLLLWKGRLSWVQCIRSKAARFGIKSYELCEAGSGYVLNIIVYTGKGSVSSQPVGGFTSATSNIVLTLLGNYIQKGYTLFMDNFYNSVELCRYLKRKATDVVGTLNRRRQNTPADIKNLDDRRMVRGTVVSRHCGDISVTSWKDVKLVSTVSTYHNSDVVEARRAGQRVLKPVVIAEYNTCMGGVDLKDQMLSGYLLERKRGMKWYIKVFRRLLNISILNSYIIYKNNVQEKQLTHREFRYQLAQALIQKYGSAVVPRSRPPHGDSIDRLNRNLNHNPEHVVETVRTSSRQNKLKRSRCVRCLAAKRRNNFTNVICSQCKVFLCIGQCYYDYHHLEIL